MCEQQKRDASFEALSVVDPGPITIESLEIRQESSDHVIRRFNCVIAFHQRTKLCNQTVIAYAYVGHRDLHLAGEIDSMCLYYATGEALSGRWADLRLSFQGCMSVKN